MAHLGKLVRYTEVNQFLQVIHPDSYNSSFNL